MKKETMIALCGLVFIALLVVALFNHKDAQVAVDETLHEIKTADAWQQSAHAPCPVGGPGSASPYSGPNQPVALNGAPPILAGQEKPALIKQMGAEVLQVGGGKVKITGVMGSSWADKAGLKANDILLSFNGKKITSLQQFQDLTLSAPPEKEYKVTYLRGGRLKKALLMIGEGEMEGFTPIPQPK
ncbi:MAG: PDZ domain-containing protein [Candidatus Omnitrophica bacterium]|nr:PDZ domain-containing protein [Candidatus Omnitrophota bacterium]